MGGQRERWEKEKRYKDYQRSKKRGKTRRNARNATKAANAQWSAIADQIKDAGKKIRKERKQGARKQWQR